MLFVNACRWGYDNFKWNKRFWCSNYIPHLSGSNCFHCFFPRFVVTSPCSCDIGWSLTNPAKSELDLIECWLCGVWEITENILYLLTTIQSKVSKSLNHLAHSEPVTTWRNADNLPTRGHPPNQRWGKPGGNRGKPGKHGARGIPSLHHHPQPKTEDGPLGCFHK